MHDNQLNDAEREAAAQILGVLAQFSPEQADRILAHVQHRTDVCDPPMFARGIAGPLGKLDLDAKTKLDENTHRLYLQLCAMCQTDVSNDLRDYIYLRVYGKTFRQMALEKSNHDADRTKALAQLIGSFQGPESGGAHHG